MKNEYSIIYIAVAMIVGLLSLVGAIIYVAATEDDGRENEIISLRSGSIKTIEAYGEKHQYLLVDRGITHLPNCKYCKEKDRFRSYNSK